MEQCNHRVTQLWCKQLKPGNRERTGQCSVCPGSGLTLVHQMDSVICYVDFGDFSKTVFYTVICFILYIELGIITI